MEAGFLRAAWPPGTPAWLRVELHTTAARSERQVDKMERTERWTRIELGRGRGGCGGGIRGTVIKEEEKIEGGGKKKEREEKRRMNK